MTRMKKAETLSLSSKASELVRFYPEKRSDNKNGFYVSTGAWLLLARMCSKVKSEGKNRHIFFEARERTAIALHFSSSRESALKMVQRDTRILLRAGLIERIDGGYSGRTTRYKIRVEELYNQVGGWIESLYSADFDTRTSVETNIKEIVYNFTPRANSHAPAPALVSGHMLNNMRAQVAARNADEDIDAWEHEYTDDIGF